MGRILPQRIACFTAGLLFALIGVEGGVFAQSPAAWKANPCPGSLRNEQALNTSDNDWGAALYGSGIAFCSDRQISINTPYETDEHKLQRVLMAEFNGEGWKNVRAFERPINGANFNSGPISFFSDEVNFIESRSSGQPDLPPDRKVDIVNNTGLYYSITISDTAVYIMPFDYNNVVQYSVDGPCLSPDEQVLYFASNMPGGYGGFDIYFCVRNEDGSWGEPQSCGASINTAGDEMYPGLAADNTLYFASNGHAGMGGLDIFAAKGQLSSFEKPVNLGYPINSDGDDFSLLVLNDDRVLFSSNRSGGNGGSDIYSFTYDRSKQYSGYMPASAATADEAVVAQQQQTTAATLPQEKQINAEFNIRIEVINRYGKPLSNASVRLVDNTAGKYAYLTTDAVGIAAANMTLGSSYTLTAGKDGYASVGIHFVMPNTTKRVIARLTLEPLIFARDIRKADLHFERKAAEAKRKQQATATQKSAAAKKVAPKRAAPPKKVAPVKQVQPQPQPTKPQAKKEAYSAPPFGSFEIREVEAKKERGSIRLFRKR